MPKITEEKTEANPKGDPVQRKVVFYPLTSLEDAKLEDGLFRSVEGEPILEVETDEKGNYTAVLPPGNYSVFTQEEGGLFANRFDGEGNIQPVQVKQGEWSKLDITINYKAYF
ncbi:carboxypeptidase regulatory-like domain-containing protein [Algoriphagus namhaensis]